MTYRASKKARKLWSERSHAAKERKRLAQAIEPLPLLADDHITIEVRRKLTGEVAKFELLPGNRCDNYSVYCNDKHLGIMGITKVCAGIRKALPRVQSNY